MSVRGRPKPVIVCCSKSVGEVTGSTHGGSPAQAVDVGVVAGDVPVGAGVGVRDDCPVAVGVRVPLTRVAVGAFVPAGVGAPEHAGDIGVFRQPRRGLHESVVQASPSSQCSLLQSEEQPSQLTALPSSQVSGNSTLWLPHTGQAGRVSEANSIGVGDTPLRPTGGFDLGKMRMALPSLPLASTLAEPLIVNCSRDSTLM